MYAGTSCYPGTVFTDAPFGVLMRALVAASNPTAHGAGLQLGIGDPAVAPAFTCACLSCSTPAGVSIVANLSISLPYGSAILFEGPSGCGKSTLLRAMAGLHPLTAGTLEMPPREQVFCCIAMLMQGAAVCSDMALLECMHLQCISSIVLS